MVTKRNLFQLFALLLCASVSLTGCMDNGPHETGSFNTGDSPGLFIVNQGNFGSANASLSYYDIDGTEVENGVFMRVNGFRLGDVAQSMTIHGDRGYIVVNNSNVIFVVDVKTLKRVGRIDGLTSPRCIHFVSDTKAYVTDLHSGSVSIVDPATLRVTGQIEVGSTSTEQMVQYGKYVFINCWSYDDRVIVIDTETDTVAGEIEVDIQPKSMALDKNGKLWVMTDGGYEGSPYGYQAPALYRIDAETRAIEKTFTFELGDSLADMCIDGDSENIYFINRHIWKMSVGADELPAEPFISKADGDYSWWYSLAVDPATSEIYFADAIDYVQPGVVYRYNAQAVLADSFTVGIIPGTLCFKP